ASGFDRPHCPFDDIVGRYASINARPLLLAGIDVQFCPCQGGHVVLGGTVVQPRARTAQAGWVRTLLVIRCPTPTGSTCPPTASQSGVSSHRTKGPRSYRSSAYGPMLGPSRRLRRASSPLPSSHGDPLRSP